MKSWLMTATGMCGLLGACDVFGSDGTESTRGAVERGADAQDAGTQAASPLTITLRLVDDSVCSDGCTTVSAEVSGGVAPYDYRWSWNELEGPGPHTVCARDGAQFGLDVSDAQSGSEFSVPNTAHASFVLATRDCSEAPTPEPLATCASLSLLTDHAPEDYMIIGATADVDERGGLYVAGSLVGAMFLTPDVRIDSREKYEVGTRPFLAKYDAACALVWWRWLGDENRMTEVGSLDVDRDGQVAITTVALGSGYVGGSGGDSTSEVTVWSVDALGEVAWSIASKTPQTVHTSSMGGHGVKWGPDGSLAVYGLGDLCNTMEPAPAIGGKCVSRITRSGAPLFSRWIADANGAAVTLDADGALYAAGLSYTGALSVNGLPAQPEERNLAYIVKFDPQGNPLWLRRQGGAMLDGGNYIQSIVNVSPEGVASTAWVDSYPNPDPQQRVNVWAVEADGTPRAPAAFGTGSNAYHYALADQSDGGLSVATTGTAMFGEEGAFAAIVLQRPLDGTLSSLAPLRMDSTQDILQDLHVSPRGKHVLTRLAYPYDAQGAAAARRILIDVF